MVCKTYLADRYWESATATIQQISGYTKLIVKMASFMSTSEQVWQYRPQFELVIRIFGFLSKIWFPWIPGVHTSNSIQITFVVSGRSMLDSNRHADRVHNNGNNRLPFYNMMWPNNSYSNHHFGYMKYNEYQCLNCCYYIYQ